MYYLEVDNKRSVVSFTIWILYSSGCLLVVLRISHRIDTPPGHHSLHRSVIEPLQPCRYFWKHALNEAART